MQDFFVDIKFGYSPIRWTPDLVEKGQFRYAYYYPSGYRIT